MIGISGRNEKEEVKENKTVDEIKIIANMR